ncbi:MAG: ABC transporter ATP-binding protein [Sulfolobales archaeon]
MKLVVKGLKVEYDSKTVLKDVEFEVLSGELTFVLGPNGSGKTTLLKAVSRLINYSSGCIYIDGKDLRIYNSTEVGKVFAYAGPQIYRNTPSTVLEFLLIGRYLHQNRLQYLESQNDIEVVEKVANELSILGLLNRKLNELSSGELQRVLIARALVQEPTILLLDEPAAFLDIRYRIEILNIVKNLTKSRKLITIIASNDLQVTSPYADRIILLSKGRIVAAGRPEVLTKELIEEVFGIRVEVLNYKGNNLILPILNPTTTNQ